MTLQSRFFRFRVQPKIIDFSAEKITGSAVTRSLKVILWLKMSK